MEQYTVYMHINKINGKKYIGMTKQKVENRWKNGKGYKNNKDLWGDIIKYGWYNGFQHLIINTKLKLEEAQNLEKELIKKHKTLNSKFGYNKTKGGDIGPLGYKFTQEQKEKISNALKGKPSKRKGMVGNRKNAILSDETKQKMRENADKKPILCIELNIKYESIKEAQRKTGIKMGNISNVCNNKKGHNTAGGYHWKFIL